MTDRRRKPEKPYIEVKRTPAGDWEWHIKRDLDGVWSQARVPLKTPREAHEEARECLPIVIESIEWKNICDARKGKGKAKHERIRLVS